MDTKPYRILLIEHDPELVDIIARQTLMPLGYKVEIISNSSVAIKEVIRLSPDIILLDLNMPGLSGKDLLVAFTSQAIGAPVIIIAPEGMEEDVIQAFRLGAADYISAPIREAEIVSAVERVLSQIKERREKERLAVKLEKTNQELQRRVRELTTIYAIGKAVTSITNKQALFDKLVDGAVYVADADRGWLLVRKDDRKEFYLAAHRNLPKAYTNRMNQPWDDGLSRLVAISGEPLTIHGDPLKRFKVSQIAKSALVVPVRVQKEVVGILTVTREKEVPFTHSNQTMLEAVADYASISLVNARLFEALEERAKYLQDVAAKAEENEQLKTQILQSVNEELRKPIQAISGYVDILMSKDEKLVGKDIRETLSLISDKLEQLMHVIDAINILQESSRKNRLATVDLAEIAEHSLRDIAPTVEEKQLRVNVDIPSNELIVKVDPVKIGQVFDALLSNAVAYCPRDGKITIWADKKRGKALVSITDTGPGIKEEHLSKVFNPFFRADVNRNDMDNGMGVGLAVAREIIRTHGGEMWVESQQGQGATFYFTIPLVEKS